MPSLPAFGSPKHPLLCTLVPRLAPTTRLPADGIVRGLNIIYRKPAFLCVTRPVPPSSGHTARHGYRGAFGKAQLVLVACLEAVNGGYHRPIRRVQRAVARLGLMA